MSSYVRLMGGDSEDAAGVAADPDALFAALDGEGWADVDDASDNRREWSGRLFEFWGAQRLRTTAKVAKRQPTHRLPHVRQRKRPRLAAVRSVLLLCTVCVGCVATSATAHALYPGCS